MEGMAVKNTCGLCMYAWKDEENPSMIRCRRFPPHTQFNTNLKGGKVQIRSEFPVLRADDGWCGEFKRALSS